MEFFDDSQPAAFPVAVMFKRKPAVNRWTDYSWQAVGVVVNDTAAAGGLKVREAADGDDYLWGGFEVRLYKDEAESYYHNLLAAQPKLYVIAKRNAQGAPEPFLVSASFDAANAYLEADEDAYPVPMPAELYQWVERFVVTYYFPEQRQKRKRQNWKDSENERKRP